MKEIVNILMRRDGDSREEAVRRIIEEANRELR